MIEREVLVVGGGSAAVLAQGHRDANAVAERDVTPPTDSGARRTDTGAALGVESPDTREADIAQRDSAAIAAELTEMLEGMGDPHRRATIRARATAYYDDPMPSASLRAAAAANVAQSYLEEQQIADEQRTTEGCRWYTLAGRLNPANLTYLRILTQLECGS